ncbi:MAG: hypothetical protein PUC90_02785 [Prevotella sp.]|nr:hypothetical protein [Prevotella sp.]
MNILDKAGLTKVWAKIKATFATKSELGNYVGGSVWAESLEIAHNNTGVDVMLNNANGSPNTSTEIEAATTTLAGVMSPEDKKRLDGIALGIKTSQRMFVGTTKGAGSNPFYGASGDCAGAPVTKVLNIGDKTLWCVEVTGDYEDQLYYMLLNGSGTQLATYNYYYTNDNDRKFLWYITLPSSASNGSYWIGY